jgi:DNA-3-methyladenine glycosylase II
MTLMPVRRSVELEAKPPFDFPLALRYVATSPSAILERVSSDGVYRRALRLSGQDVLLVVRSLGTTERPRLLLQVIGDHEVSDGVLETAITTVRRTFTLDADVTEFVALAERDPIFGTLITCLHGIRPILIPDPFEALIWAVIGQQINVAFARKLKLALVEICGRLLSLPEIGDYPLSPEPEVIAAVEIEQLRGRQYSRQKAEYVLELARAVADGELDLSLVASMPHEEAIAAITRFRGAGRWTAEYVLMRGLGMRDSLPAGDLGLRAVIGRWYGLDRHASESEVRELAERWAGWRGWAAFYWWFATQSKWFSPEDCNMVDWHLAH